MEETSADSCGCGCDRCDLCGDKWDCKPDRTGTDSSSGDHTAGQNAEKAMVIKKAGCINVDIKLLHGVRHEILNDIKREKVYAILYNWLEKNI